MIFKDDLDHRCAELSAEEQRLVSIITVAAPRHRQLTKGYKKFLHKSDSQNLRDKIRLIYRMAGVNHQEYLVLGGLSLLYMVFHDRSLCLIQVRWDVARTVVLLKRLRMR